jgi:uncharacterized protein
MADVSIAPRSRLRRAAAILVAGLGPVLVVAVIALVQIVLYPRVPVAAGAGVVTLCALATYYAHARWLERRTPSELAVAALPQVVWGALLGGALLVATLAVLAAAGVYHLLGRSAFSVDFPKMIALGALTAVTEELLFRGYLFRWLARLNVWLAIALSAALFGALHFFNEHGNAFSSFAIALEAGVLLSVAYVASGNLWFPIGIHFGWNFLEGPIFNVPISGNPTPGLVLGTLDGPQWVTGGAFGVEASVGAIGVCLCAAAVLLLRARTSGRLAAFPRLGSAPP